MTMTGKSGRIVLPSRGDMVLPAWLVVIALAEIWLLDLSPGPRVVTTLCSAIGYAGLTYRRVLPLASLGWLIAAMLVQALLGSPLESPSGFFAVLLATYSVAIRAAAGIAIAATLVTIVAVWFGTAWHDASVPDLVYPAVFLSLAGG